MFLLAILALCCCSVGHADWGLHSVPVLAGTELRPSHFGHGHFGHGCAHPPVFSSADAPIADLPTGGYPCYGTVEVVQKAAHLRRHEFHHRIVAAAQVYGGDLKSAK